jgi:histone acetyltransferase (RNA polymerase elongator complex component)
MIIPTVKKHLETAPPGVRAEIAFFGGSFTGIAVEEQTALLAEAKRALTLELVSGVRASTRPDYIDDTVCGRLRSFGVTTLELGIQSFSDEVLLKSGRGHTSADSVRALETLRANGIDTVIQLLPGLPGDTFETSLASAETAASFLPSGVRIYPAIVLEQTALADLYRSGEYQPLKMEDAVDLCARMTELFNKKSIPVIKTGLHPFSETKCASIIAGPYHPAFGFFVKARIRRNELALKARDFIALNLGTERPVLGLPAVNAEEYIGHRKENIEWLETNFGLKITDYRIHEDISCPTFFIDAKFPD